MTTITKKQYTKLKARIAAFDAWIDTIRGLKDWASYRDEDIPATLARVSNAERSQVEVYEFETSPPDRYFLYVQEDKGIATTFPGDVLGYIGLGRSYRSNFGDERVQITIAAINGCIYHGTYYKSAGSYARVKLSARRRRTAHPTQAVILAQ